MKKILFSTLGLLLALSVTPQLARGLELPEGFNASHMRALEALLREPCRRIYLQLKKFNTCPPGRECVEISGVTVDKFHLDNGDSLCVIRKGERPEGHFVGSFNGLVEQNASVILTAMSQKDDGGYSFYYGINNMEEFLNYNGYLLSLAANAGESYIVFKDVVDATQVVEEEEPEAGVVPVAGGAPWQRDLIDALRPANGEGAEAGPAGGVLPARLGDAVNLEGIPGAKKRSLRDAVGDNPFNPIPVKWLKRLAAASEPEVVEPDAAVDAAVGDPDASASGGNDAPVADLEATEVNPNTNTLCALNTSIVPNMSSLAYVGFAFIGMVLAGIRRRIRSRRDR